MFLMILTVLVGLLLAEVATRQPPPWSTALRIVAVLLILVVLLRMLGQLSLPL